MKGIYCDHPRKSLSGQEYCSYYAETYYSLKEVFDIEYVSSIPRKISEFGNVDFVILGYAHTDTGWDSSPISVLNDTNTLLFPIINKEYAGIDRKLDWVKGMGATSAFSVHHEVEKYSESTGVPFHRIMWSANQDIFKDYGEDYTSDLFFSGVTRPDQTENLRERVLSEMTRLSDYKLEINARSHKNNYAGQIYSDREYARKLASSKICFITTGPSDLVGTRYFEVMAGNKSLILCNRMSEVVYGDMLVDGYNCVMFSTVDEFFDKAEYYLNNEEDRMKIVNTAYSNFLSSQTWIHRAKDIKKIIGEYQ